LSPFFVRRVVFRRKKTHFRIGHRSEEGSGQKLAGKTTKNSTNCFFPDETEKSGHGHEKGGQQALNLITFKRRRKGLKDGQLHARDRRSV
jgi:hypothetical protein